MIYAVNFSAHEYIMQCVSENFPDKKIPRCVLQRGIFLERVFKALKFYLTAWSSESLPTTNWVRRKNFFAVKNGEVSWAAPKKFVRLVSVIKWIYPLRRRVPDRPPASKQKFPCSLRWHRRWRFSSWLLPPVVVDFQSLGTLHSIAPEIFLWTSNRYRFMPRLLLFINCLRTATLWQA